MASEYRLIGMGADANGENWAIGLRGPDVVLTVDPTVTELRFDGDARDRFIQAWAHAEQITEREARHG
jgi:hypothetical protein